MERVLILILHEIGNLLIHGKGNYLYPKLANALADSLSSLLSVLSLLKSVRMWPTLSLLDVAMAGPGRGLMGLLFLSWLMAIHTCFITLPLGCHNHTGFVVRFNVASLKPYQENPVGQNHDEGKRVQHALLPLM